MAAAGSTRVPAPTDGGGVVPVLAILGIVAIAGCVVLAVAGLSGRRAEANRAEARAAAERQAGLIALQLQEIESAVEHLDTRQCPRPQARPPGVLALACVGLDEVEVPGADLGPVLTDPEARSALGQARDRGTGVLSAPVGTDPGVPLVAAALYDTGGPDLSREASERSVSARRAEVAGFAIAVVDVEALVEASSTPVRVDDAGTPLLGADVSGSSATADAAALGRRWTVSVPVEPLGWWRPFASGSILLGLAAALFLGMADRQRRRAMRTQADAARRAEGHSAAVRSLAGIVQQSQGLDEILPALAVQLSDELHLAGLSLAVVTGPSLEREVFVHGVPPDRTVRHDVRSSGRLAAGETLALDLHRADRSIGTLRVRAGQALDPEETDIVQVAGEMVTSTVIASRSIEQQQEAVNRLEALDELKTTFLGVASHELRTPATAISGLATLLAQRWDALSEDDRRSFAQRIATNADSLNALVQDLLDFARLERGDLRLNLAPVDLTAAVEGVLARLDGVWASHGVERRLEHGVWVLGDANAIERIVTNLVSNAVKFSPEGSPVRVSVERVGDQACLVVEDRGPGVPPEEREKIFIRFFRGSGDGVVRTRGVGIGLSVVQDFVAQMGGTVRVEDADGGGARFVVELDEHDRSTLEERDVATT